MVRNHSYINLISCDRSPLNKRYLSLQDTSQHNLIFFFLEILTSLVSDQLSSFDQHAESPGFHSQHYREGGEEGEGKGKRRRRGRGRGREETAQQMPALNARDPWKRVRENTDFHVVTKLPISPPHVCAVTRVHKQNEHKKREF